MDAVLISLLTILLGFVLILIIFHTNWWVEIPRITTTSKKSSLYHPTFLILEQTILGKRLSSTNYYNYLMMMR